MATAAGCLSPEPTSVSALDVKAISGPSPVPRRNVVASKLPSEPTIITAPSRSPGRLGVKVTPTVQEVPEVIAPQVVLVGAARLKSSGAEPSVKTFPTETPWGKVTLYFMVNVSLQGAGVAWPRGHTFTGPKLTPRVSSSNTVLEPVL